LASEPPRKLFLHFSFQKGKKGAKKAKKGKEGKQKGDSDLF
jgi:hypothetical protein